MRGKRRRREGSRKPREEGDVERGDGERQFEADRQILGTERGRQAQKDRIHGLGQDGEEAEVLWVATDCPR